MINLFLAPVAADSGLTSISLGLLQALDAMGLKPSFLKPVAPGNPHPERSTALVRSVTPLDPPNPLALELAQERISAGMMDRVLEDAIALHHQVTADNPPVTLIEGLVPERTQTYSARLNIDLAKAMDAEVILVVGGEGRDLQSLTRDLQLQEGLFRSAGIPVCGYLINRWNGNANGESLPQLSLPCLGVVPYSPELTWLRTSDLETVTHASALIPGERLQRRVSRVHLGAGTLRSTLPELTAGTLLVTPADRDDLILAAAVCSGRGVPLAGLLLTNGGVPDDTVMESCGSAVTSGLPILRTELGLTEVARLLGEVRYQVPVDDHERVHRIMNQIADHIDTQLLRRAIDAPHVHHLSPAAFRYQIVSKAAQQRQRIVLPEGDEPRTIEAAINCQQRGIADCILLGDPTQIQQLVDARGLTLPEDLTIADPASLREQYAPAMVERRKHKQLTLDGALAMLEDNVVLGTMMLAENDVEGLVSGAVHTTANTIRPALQLIKTAPSARLVSSVFFMGLSDQVLVYGDCAVNPDPNAEELADIAIQSADSARAMGIPPRVAMISYSTGESGSGSDVEKVRAATALVRQQRLDLEVDGPLQYDAATTPEVARKKAPDSKVAGQATVLIFPDLNTGNTTYKAVQRSARVISIGPMLQGLAKPVNDLSRGASVEDIIYTIALTAIQAQQRR